MPLYDLLCTKCGCRRDDVLTSKPRDVECPICHDTMMVLPSAPSSFKVEGFNAANGYSGKGDKQ